MVAVQPDNAALRQPALEQSHPGFLMWSQLLFDIALRPASPLAVR